MSGQLASYHIEYTIPHQISFRNAQSFTKSLISSHLLLTKLSFQNHNTNLKIIGRIRKHMVFTVTPRIPFRGFNLRDPVNHGAVRDGGLETCKICNLIENLFNYKFSFRKKLACGVYNLDNSETCK